MADGTAQATQAALPFTIASRASTRNSFTVPATPLGTGTVTPPNTPVQIPAVGFARSITIEFTVTATGGTPTLNADAPWSLINQVTLKTSSGSNLIAPLSGYEWYLANKYGGFNKGLVTPLGINQDPKIDRSYVASGTQLHFYLEVPIELDQSQALGSIPALASNRSYQLELSYNSIGTVFGGTIPTAVSVAADATVNYWDVPGAATPGGVPQQTEPFGLGTTSLWQKEVPILAPGEQYTRSNNTGNVVREIILISRTSAGVRNDVDWTPIFELFIDNNPQIRLKKGEFQRMMQNYFGFNNSALDSAGGLDTGVYVLPFQAFAGGSHGDTSSSRAQLLATLDSTLLQFHGTSWGSGVAGGTLTILSNVVSSANAAFIYSK